jgi:hypothetical protein
MIRGRRKQVLLLAVLASVGLGGCNTPEASGAGPVVAVYKSPTCGCCTLWEDHLRENGFVVQSHELTDLSQVKSQQGVPAALGSCHTAVVEGYVVEGHVPADVIRRLLAERPEVDGIAVPGMPMGSPGMEGPFTESYEVFTFKDGAPHEVYEIR